MLRTEVEAQRERNDVPGDYVSIKLVIQVYLRVILKAFEVRRGEKGESVSLQVSISKDVHHLNQCSVQHLYIVRSLLNEILVYLIIAAVFQCELHMLRAFKSNLSNIGMPCLLKREPLIIRETNPYQIADEFVDLRFNLA